MSWAWPPIGRVGAMRPLGVAREWTSCGDEVHVLTGPGDRGGEYTPDLLPAAHASGARVHRAPAPGIDPPDGLRAAFDQPREAHIGRQISRLRQIGGQWRGFPDAQRSWIAPAVGLGLDLVRGTPFDVMWTTSPPESVHYVGRELAPHVGRWIADFRDQWSEYLLARWDPMSRWIIDRITGRVLSRAAAITAATEGVARSIQSATGRPVECVRNGFDDSFPAEPAPPPRDRVLGYFGRIDPLMQRPERLWPALRRARESGRPWRLEIYSAPGGGGGADVTVPSDLVDLVQVLPPLPHPEALARMRTMSALLVLAWETRRGETSVAAKLYEYVGARRPVLVCAPTGFEARDLVESTGTGLGAWTAEEIAGALTALERFVINDAGRESLSRAHSARRLREIFERARGRPSAVR